MAMTAAKLYTSNLYTHTYLDIGDILHVAGTTARQSRWIEELNFRQTTVNGLGILGGTNPYLGFSRDSSPAFSYFVLVQIYLFTTSLWSRDVLRWSAYIPTRG